MKFEIEFLWESRPEKDVMFTLPALSADAAIYILQKIRQKLKTFKGTVGPDWIAPRITIES